MSVTGKDPLDSPPYLFKKIDAMNLGSVHTCKKRSTDYS